MRIELDKEEESQKSSKEEVPILKEVSRETKDFEGGKGKIEGKTVGSQEIKWERCTDRSI